MAVDVGLMQTIEEAQIAVAAEDLRKHMQEHREDVTALLQAQEGLDGVSSAVVTSTATEITLWNRETGVPSKFTYDNLTAGLSRRFEAAHPTMGGQRVYTSIRMDPITVGHLMCPLHKDHPDRNLVDSLGFGSVVCKGNKSNLLTQLDVDNHVKHTHKALYARMERQRTEALSDRQMNLLQQQTDALIALAGRGIDVPATAAAPAARAKAIPPQRQCEDCDFVTPEGHGAPQLVMAKHRKEAHPTN